ncbi:MAG TPA: hypothetical protein VIX86_00640 [Streptosporangiaceae bacterium]
MASRAKWQSRGLAGLWLTVIAVMVAACAAPQFTYVANSASQTYFKVPNGWHKLSDAAIAHALGGAKSATVPVGVWSVGYDGSSIPSASHIFGASASQPFALALVEPLSATAANSMSYNSLRDVFLPVTSTTRQSATKSGFPLTGFHLLQDSVLTPGQGVHGVRDIFDYTFPGGSTDTFDQIAFTNADNTELYLLVLHCLATCYQKHTGEINTVMSSFTVRSS